MMCILPGILPGGCITRFAQERLYKMFEQFDVDKSGTIDAEELRQVRSNVVTW